MYMHFHLLKWLIPNSVLIFAALGAWHFGFLFSLYSNDRSYISTLITIIYIITSLYCLYRTYFLSDQINSINKIKKIFQEKPNAKLFIKDEIIHTDTNFKLKKGTQLNDYLKNAY